MEKEFKNYQIIRLDGRNMFIEVLSSMLGLENPKIIINFVQYDKNKPKGKRIGTEIPIFIDLVEAKTFFYLAANGGFNGYAKVALQKQKQGGYKFAAPVFSSLGGTTANTLKAQGRPRKDNGHEARVFELIPGNKQPWVLMAKRGKGKLHDTGLISLEGRPDEYLQIGLSDFDFRKLGIIVTDSIKMIENKIMFGGDNSVDTPVNITELAKTANDILRGIVSLHNLNK